MNLTSARKLLLARGFTSQTDLVLWSRTSDRNVIVHLKLGTAVTYPLTYRFTSQTLVVSFSGHRELELAVTYQTLRPLSDLVSAGE